ncbi:hypothetical protein NL108_004114 [Boleophthalmus pectinirostris]|nr:hypothetical protein NL108_004114 [Boleophthalmus pectinirostris]
MVWVFLRLRCDLYIKMFTLTANRGHSSLVCEYLLLLFLLYHCHFALLRMSPAERASVLLQVVKHAAESGNRVAERKFGESNREGAPCKFSGSHWMESTKPGLQ